MKRIFLGILTCFLVVSCSLQEDDQLATFEIKTLPIKSVDFSTEAFTLGSLQSVEITYYLQSSCNKFRELYIRQDGNTQIVSVIADVTGSRDCKEIAKEETHTYSFKIALDENYIFKFWKGKDSNGNDLYHEVTIPVVTQT